MRSKSLLLSVITGVITVSIIMSCVWLFDIYIGYSYLSNSLPKHKDSRVVRLREKIPNSSRVRVPSRKYLKTTDGLDPNKETNIRVDENGFIMPSRVYEEPDLSIVFLGGSTTVCSFVDEEKRFPYATAKSLGNTLDLKINGFNGGQGGNHSMHSTIALLAKVVPMRPQVVVLMHNVNDLNTMIFEGTYWNQNKSRSIVVSIPEITGGLASFYNPNQMEQGVLTNWFPNIAHRYKNLIDPKDEWSDKRGHSKTDINQKYMTREFSRSLRSFVTLARTWGITPILMTQPNRLTEEPDTLIRNIFDQYEKDWGVNYIQYRTLYLAFEEAIRNVASETSTPIIDLARKIPQESTYIYDTVHLTDTGSLMVAKLITEQLVSIIPSIANMN